MSSEGRIRTCDTIIPRMIAVRTTRMIRFSCALPVRKYNYIPGLSVPYHFVICKPSFLEGLVLLCRTHPHFRSDPGTPSALRAVSPDCHVPYHFVICKPSFSGSLGSASHNASSLSFGSGDALGSSSRFPGLSCAISLRDLQAFLFRKSWFCFA